MDQIARPDWPRLRVLRVRVLEHVESHVARQAGSHEIEHDGVDDLVTAAPGAEPARDRPPQCSPQDRGESRQHRSQRRPQAGPDRAHRRRRQGPHRELSFRANVEKPRMKRDRHRQTGEDERGRIEQRHAEVIARSERPFAQNNKNMPWVLPRQPRDGQPQGKP